MSNSPFVMVDGSSYLFRAFHAMPPLTNSRGEPTGAMLGVINMLEKLLREHEPEHVAVVFDASGKTFRDELFAEYKANRPPMPDDLRAQVQPLLDMVQAMGLPLLRVEGVEADDVIGTLARVAAAEQRDTLISTGDKDMAQLVGEYVTLVNTMSGTTLDPDGVEEKFGVRPDQIVDYLALVGDSSDNIPGVPRVGAKTAAKWLGQYHDIDGIVANADAIKGKVGESLREHLEQLELSRKLATIKIDVALDMQPEALTRSDPDTGKLREMFGQYEFRSLLRRLEGSGDGDEDGEAEQQAAPIPPPEVHYETVLESDRFEAWLKRLKDAELFAFDTETTSLDYMEAVVVGVSFAVKSGEAAYVPLSHSYPGAPEQLDRDTVLEKLRPLLEDENCAKLGHHLKYDAHVLRNHGIMLRGMRFDSMLESYVLNSTASRHDMDSLAKLYLNRNTVHYEDVAGKGARQITFDQVPLETAAPYAAEDADITLQLHEKLWSQLSEHESLVSVYRDIEQPLVPVLAEMEYTGVLLDTDMLAAQGKELESRGAELVEQAYEAAGEKFNLGSPKQLQEILFQRLGLPVIRKTPKGQPSTAEDVLQELANDYPLPKIILEYRSLTKLKSTYTDKLPQQVNARTGRVHTSYHQAVAATGRLSSTHPNLQNIPIRTQEGRRIRQAFVPPEGHVLLAADYSQIELRIMAHLSGDEGLLAAFAADQDIHTATASEVFDTPVEDVTTELRRSAKAINFGLIYGMSAFGLARQLGIDRGSAQQYVDLYFERYPGVKAYMDRTRRTALEKGYVETVFGRRLYLPEINSRNAQRRQYAERSAINAPMQGTAADIIKRAMISVHAALSAENLPARLIMQVHDELVLEVQADAAAVVDGRICEIMSKSAELDVPLKVDSGIGSNWDEAH